MLGGLTRSKTSDGKGRPCRLTIYVPETVQDASAWDRETGRFNGKINRMLEVLYANGGRTDSIQILKAEYEAEIGRLQALVASLDAQEEAATEALAQETRLKKAEEDLRAHVRMAIQRGADFKQWLHPGRADVKAVGGIQRARQIMKEEGVTV